MSASGGASGHVGEICALVAPLCWSVAILFYRRTLLGREGVAGVTPEAMTLFKNTAATGLLLATMAVLGVAFPPDRSATDWARLAASGILGLAVGDTALFHALRRIGAARVAIVDTIYAPTVVTLSWLVLGEPLGGWFLAGAALVVCGVGVANLQRGDAPEVERADAVAGTLFGLGAIVATALGVLLSKPVLEGSHLVEVTATRMVFGVLAQVAWSAVRRDPASFAAFRLSTGAWRGLVPAAFVGTYLSLLFWMGGFKWAPASVAAVLNQLATVYILVLAALVLGERVQRHQLAGGLLAVLGAVVVVLAR